MLVEWKKVPDYPDYSISNYGSVRRDTDMVGPGKRNTWAGKILKLGNSRGYTIASLTNKDGVKSFRVSRLVLTIFIGEPPTVDHQAAHTDGKTNNNYVGNLRWATGVENAQDRKNHGHYSLPRKSRLTQTEINEIIEMGKSKLKVSAIADRFCVSPGYITMICNGKRLKSHIDGIV